jgi:hypothetical protein
MSSFAGQGSETVMKFLLWRASLHWLKVWVVGICRLFYWLFALL